MQKLSYPFHDNSEKQLLEVAKKIIIKEENTSISFYVNKKKIEEDKLYMGMISYIKLIEILIKDKKDVNKIISEIKADVVNRIVDLKDAGEKVLLEKLGFTESNIMLFLLKNIIEAYEIEYDVIKTENPKKYRPLKDKTCETMSMKKELILELTKTA